MKRVVSSIVTGCVIILILAACSTTIKHNLEYYPNDQVKEQWTESKDSSGVFVRHGKYLSWHQNGQERTVGEYSLGGKVGLWTTKDPNGRLAEWEEYENGERHGLSVSYHANRNKKHEGKYVRGKREGVWRCWQENGMLKEDGSYVEGERHGMWVSWSQSGQKTEETMYQQGVAGSDMSQLKQCKPGS